jgi:dTDP-4-amino-4,6-dideoxygalactose transaminase
MPVTKLVNTKTAVADLAIAGGEPMFPEVVHVGRPNIGDRQRLLERINDLLDRRWLTNNGQYVQEFERRITEFIGARHCVALSNGTVGLEIALRALNLRGEVIVPSFTFAATVHALQWLGITPVFCDVNPVSHTMDWRCVEKLISPRTTGLLAVHLWGGACDVDELAEIAVRHDLQLVFDAAHAFGCWYNGRMMATSAMPKFSVFMPLRSSTRSRAARSSQTTMISPLGCARCGTSAFKP